MTFCKPAVKIYGLSAIFLIIIGFLVSPAYAVTPVQSSVTITNPADNGFLSSTSVIVSGTYVSPNTPTLVLTVDGTNYTQNVASGTWSTSLTLVNGWHQLVATLQDSNGIKKTSTQFLVWTGHRKPIISMICFLFL